MAEIDSHVSGRSGEQGKAMGVAQSKPAPTHSWAESLVQRAWTGIGDKPLISDVESFTWSNADGK